MEVEAVLLSVDEVQGTQNTTVKHSISRHSERSLGLSTAGFEPAKDSTQRN